MTRSLSFVMVAALALAGCQSGGDTPDGSTSPTTSGEPTTSAPVTVSPPASDDATESETSTGSETSTAEATETEQPVDLPWTTGPVEEDVVTGGEAQEITGVRIGEHDGYDRVVLDLSGDQRLLGWHAEFVDQAVEDPSGRPLEVDGTAYLQIGVRGIDWTNDSADRYDGAPVDADDTEIVEEVVFGGLFEGQQQIVIGLDERTEFRVFGLDDPARIVIDVRED
ncbi:AMIN-like domain-containing (lipo)protein [Ornithinimicrobium tianjinense]|uniref:AMIN-like domain-containing protein n=1 Tax=Ornithinimicrobium tianjinense TaxID=1195761 RepID=A0A917BH97_9MICO|nr:hypothetical protein [Ornithinimicrobium tianjinense]GGF39743.1 hypothetical protein GCM10011366_04200 [Ornithinimicrobium tianjinense]